MQQGFDEDLYQHVHEYATNAAFTEREKLAIEYAERFALDHRAIGDDGTMWYDTPNIHLCTIRDFVELCRTLDLEVERAVSLSRTGSSWEISRIGAAANLLGQQGIFCLTRN